MTTLATEMQNVARPPQIRTLAGVQLKNLVTSSRDDATREMLAQRWITFGPDVREHVKAAVRASACACVRVCVCVCVTHCVPVCDSVCPRVRFSV